MNASIFCDVKAFRGMQKKKSRNNLFSTERFLIINSMIFEIDKVNEQILWNKRYSKKSTRMVLRISTK